MKKVKHQKRFRIEHLGNSWIVDCAEWIDENGKGELRVYRVEGAVGSLLQEALEQEAQSRGAKLIN